jgi:hypothetical protein
MAGKKRRDGRGREHEREREHADPRGRDFPVFLKIRGARWLGSEPPTAEAYAKALGNAAGGSKPPGSTDEKGKP